MKDGTGGTTEDPTTEGTPPDPVSVSSRKNEGRFHRDVGEDGVSDGTEESRNRSIHTPKLVCYGDSEVVVLVVVLSRRDRPPQGCRPLYSTKRRGPPRSPRTGVHQWSILVQRPKWETPPLSLSPSAELHTAFPSKKRKRKKCQNNYTLTICFFLGTHITYICKLLKPVDVCGHFGSNSSTIIYVGSEGFHRNIR